MRLAIIGCGYVGERLVRASRGAGLVVTTRRPERAAALRALGADARVVDPADPADVTALAAVLEGCDAAVCSVPPGPDGEPTAAICAALAVARVPVCVYLGSTGVYPAAAGRVDEATPVGAPGELAASGQARLAAERLLGEAARATGLRVAVLRIAAIYGPGRGVHLRLRAGTHRIAGDGTNHVSRVHVDDLCRVIEAAARVLAAAPAGTVRVFCVADDEPTTARGYADAVAEALGVAPAPSVPAGEVHESLRGDRRVANERMKTELGVRLAHPTWREGLRQCLDEEAAVSERR